MGPVEIGEIATALDGHPATTGLSVLVLHGSRARGDAGPGSDWDFAYIADDRVPAASFDPVALLAALIRILGTDAVDLVDLRSASALLRYRAARDGKLLHEDPEGAFLAFRLDAVRFWCDAGPVIRAAQADVLASLG